MLIWNEYNLHTNYEVRDWCWKHYIIFFIFSSHATHLLQFLNVICFQSYKYYHCQALDWSLHLSIFDFNWLNFIVTFIKVHAKIFKSSTSLSVFEKTDLIFYNPEKVLKSLHEKLQKSMSASTSSSIFLHTIADTWSTIS